MKQSLIHHAIFWLKNPTKENIDKLVEGVKTLSAVPQVKALHVGVVASTEQRDVVDASWSVSEIMFFDSLDDQAIYQTHPVHQSFIANYGHLWERVAVYDALNV